MSDWVTYPADRGQKEAALPLRPARWVLSTLSWCPFLAWLIWPLWDAQLDLDPWVAAIGAAGLVAVWIYSGWSGARSRLWITLLGTLIVFAVSHSVGARSGRLGAFLAISTVGWTLANSILGGLTSAWAADVALVGSYRAAEETALRTVMLSETALVAGVATARIGSNVGSVFLGLAAGALIGGVIAWFAFAVVYTVMNVALVLVHGD
jgi:hypothetical protein